MLTDNEAAVPIHVAPPLDATGLLDEGWLIATVDVNAQPLASVAVTVYVPNAKPVCVEEVLPADQL